MSDSAKTIDRPTAAESADDLKRMAPVYIGVIVVEVLVLLGLWTFQTYFG